MLQIIEVRREVTATNDCITRTPLEGKHESLRAAQEIAAYCGELYEHDRTGRPRKIRWFEYVEEG